MPQPDEGLLPEPSSDGGDSDDESSFDEPKRSTESDSASSLLRTPPANAYAWEADAKPDVVAELDNDGKWTEGADASFLADELRQRRAVAYERRIVTRACLACLAVIAALAAAAYMMYIRPVHIDCSVHQLHAQRFKVDVSELWEPRLSASLQVGPALLGSLPPHPPPYPPPTPRWRLAAGARGAQPQPHARHAAR